MNKSLWLDQPEIKRYPRLEDDLEVDVAVIGGGITGIVSALTLVEEGFKVGIVDSGRFFHGTTGHTTAKVTIQHGLIYDTLISKHGLEGAQLYVDSNKRAMHQIKQNIKNYEIDCDYEEKIAYVYTQKEAYISNIEKDLEAALKLNIDAFVTEQLNLPFEIKSALGFNNQGQFHVTKYLTKLLEQFEKNDDGYIFENSKVVKIVEDNNFCHSFLENGKKIKSQHVIIASHFPCHGLLSGYFTILKPTVTYLMAAESKIPLDNGTGYYISHEKPKRTLRTQMLNGKNYLIFGGENHKTGHFHQEAKTHLDNIAEFGHRYFETQEIKYKWMTQDFNTFDKLPYIGKVNNKYKHVYVATGFSKWGMTQSHVAAMVLKDIITNKKSEYEELYSPNRLSDKFNIQFFDYNISSGIKFVSGRLKPSPKDIHLTQGEGKIFIHKGKKYGAYKDEFGETFVVDVTCPHLKCILEFNNSEKTYDCPCHGSRFTYKGEYIDGPSIKDLKRINFKNLK